MNDASSVTSDGRPKPDIRISNQGTVFVFTPVSAVARTWFDANVSYEQWQVFGNGIVVDHRFAADLARFAQSCGLVLI